MTPEQIIQLRSQLISKGYDDEQATDMIAIIQNNIDAKGEVWAKMIQQIISEGLSNDAVQRALINFSEKEERIEKLQIESQEKFHRFLSNLNMWQKIYSLAFIMFGGGVIYFLGSRNIIGKETCQILLTMIITLTVTDAVSTFLKANKNDGE